MGSSGAGSGGAGSSMTVPNRRPAIQSSRAATTSSCERPTKFHHITSGSSNGVLAEPLDFVGTAPGQVAAFVASVEALVAADPQAAAYRPGDIL